jgi:hypothetical protein
MGSTERDKRLHMLLSDDEDRMLRALAAADGLSSSDIVRQLVRKAFAERFAEGTKMPKTRR